MTHQIDGDALRRHREMSGHTLRSLAKSCQALGVQVTYSHLSKVERGKSGTTPPCFAALAQVLHLDPDTLIKKDGVSAV